MANRSNIRSEILRAADNVRRKYLTKLSKYTKRDTILYATAFGSPNLPKIPSSLISITSEDIQGFMTALQGLKRKELDLLIHSPGGMLEAAEQIINYLRSKYDRIRVIVPQNAMSAATIIACGADKIIMGKHSALGPIDPQITFPSQTGHFTAPAQSILDEFAEAKKSIEENPKTAPLWLNKISRYPPGFLKVCEDTVQLSKDVVLSWLKSYMFRHYPDVEREEKARKIADYLGEAKEHHSHRRPIMMKEAQDMGLNVEALEKDQKLQDHVLSVFHSIILTFETTSCVKFVENQNGKGWFLRAAIQPILQTPKI